MTRHPTGAIVLLTDFGAGDWYVGVMKGVLLQLAPGAPLVDLSHSVPPGDVRAGAFLLENAWRWFAPGTVFLVVVDPGVGTKRRPLAACADERCFVGPDNGVLSPVLAAAGDEIRHIDANAVGATNGPQTPTADPADRTRPHRRRRRGGGGAGGNAPS